MTNRVKVVIPTHYYQFDQQGVAFNMWYLAYIEQARNGFLAEQGFSLEDLLSSEHDIQVVHVEIDWKGPLRYGDPLEIEVFTERIGSSSFALRFNVIVDGEESATATSVYVIIGAHTHMKAKFPDSLRRALER
jgi:acyl-CoA thioester hydrolase